MVETIYHEKVQSLKTSLLFLILTLIFAALFAWRVSAVGFRLTPILFLFIGLFFFLYVKLSNAEDYDYRGAAFAGQHPLPDQQGIYAAQIFGIIDSLQEALPDL